MTAGSCLTPGPLPTRPLLPPSLPVPLPARLLHSHHALDQADTAQHAAGHQERLEAAGAGPGDSGYKGSPEILLDHAGRRERPASERIILGERWCTERVSGDLGE